LALGALPLAALLYRLGARLQALQKSTVGDAKSNERTSADSEKRALISPKQSWFPSWASLPVLEGYAWPEPPSSFIDGKLVVGSILFGVGWGILGACRTSIDLYSGRTM
jgi:uncharacterized membrane protein YedE/YeeE